MNLFQRLYNKRKQYELQVRYTRLFSLLCRFCGVRTVKGSNLGHPVYVDSQDNWGLRNFYFRANCNYNRIPRLQSLLRENEWVFWDIGANYGSFTLSLAADAIKIVCVEPSRRTFACLQKSCRGLDNVILEHCAAGDRSGEITLYLAAGFSGDDRIFQPANESRKQQTVAMETLDEIARRHFQPLPRKNLVKIDTQAAEILVLRGGRELFAQSDRLIICMELWPDGLEEAGYSLQELIDTCTRQNLMPVDDNLQAVSWETIKANFTESLRVQDTLLIKCT